MMKKDIPTLSDRLYEMQKRSGFASSYFKEIERLGTDEFVIYNILKYSDIYLTSLILDTLPILEKLKLQDWKKVFLQISSDLNKSVFLIKIFHKYFLIDGFNMLAAYSKIPITSRNDIIEYFKSRPDALKISEMDRKTLSLYPNSSNSLLKIRARLISDGAFEVKAEDAPTITLKGWKLDRQTGNYIPD